MSGLFGVWPISPGREAREAGASLSRSSRCAAGTSFAFGLACMSTNCAKKNSMPLLRMYARSHPRTWER